MSDIPESDEFGFDAALVIDWGTFDAQAFIEAFEAADKLKPPHAGSRRGH